MYINIQAIITTASAVTALAVRCVSGMGEVKTGLRGIALKHINRSGIFIAAFCN
jgi:uncharacterized protein with von Willebrand factor type A (vWA) domain